MSKELKGKLHETVGRATGDLKTQAKGVAEQAAGKAERAARDAQGAAKEKASNWLTKLSEWINRSGSAAMLVGALALPAFANETVGEKAENSVDRAKVGAKKQGRALKKEIRDRTGNSNKWEDTKDAGRNAKDSVEQKADELGDKVD